MTKNILLSALLLGATLFASCGKDNPEDGGQVTPPPPPITGSPMEGVELAMAVNGHVEYTLTSAGAPLLFAATIVTNDKTSLWEEPVLVQEFDDVVDFNEADVSIKGDATAAEVADVSVAGSKLTVSFPKNGGSFDYLKSKEITVEVGASVKQNADLGKFTNDGFKGASSFGVVADGEQVNASVEVRTHLDGGPITGALKVTAVGATASSHDDGHPIEATIDGDLSTYFMASSENGASFPVEVVYEFDTPSLSSFTIHPSLVSAMGLLKNIEVWYATKSNPEFVKYSDEDFNYATAAKSVTFTPELVEPTKIKLVLHQGYPPSPTKLYAAFSEIEFYRSDPNEFKWADVFTDPTCSELKPGVTQEAIDLIVDPFFKELAQNIYAGNYNTEFRVQSYKPWQRPQIMATANKTERYSLLDNPTGIFVDNDQDLVVLVGDIPENVVVELESIDLSTGGGGTRVKYAIAEGFNMFRTTARGLLYVMYHTDTATEASVKINITTGKINGYFDIAKHTQADWSRLIGATVFNYFDVLGKYAHMTMPVSQYNKYVTDIMGFVNRYDQLVRLEMEFMGLMKYNRVFKNRMWFQFDASSSAYMYATAYRTGYGASAMSNFFSLASSTSSSWSLWGPAHEVGHVNQTRPGLNWHGMTEVTNNILSLHVQVTMQGNERSRLLTSGDYYKFAQSPGSNTIIGKPMAFAESGEHFEKLIPFWQLKLYLMDALGKTDFYKDLFEHYRTSANLDTSTLTAGVYQLEFVRQVCRVANLDLTDFFTTWGFLRPVDIVINDYGDSRFTITQQQIDTLKAEIAAYPKPAHTDIHRITDATVGDYK
jgi:hypothetical protein